MKIDEFLAMQKKVRKKPRHKEDDLQMNCVRWFDLRFPQRAIRLHHSPNGGRRDAREAARFKKMGVRPGFPDLELNIPSRGWHGLYIELKTKNGRLSEYQKEYLAALKNDDYRCEVCRSLEDFQSVIYDYLFGIRHEAGTDIRKAMPRVDRKTP